MRISSYAIYPGDQAVLSKYVTFITAQRFIYDWQGITAVYNGRHTAGRPRLFMAWSLDVFASEKEFSDYTYDPKGPSQTLPRSSYYTFHDPPSPDVQYPLDSYYVSVGNGTFKITYHGLSGLPATFFQDYVHITLFDDSFDAPFLKAEVV
jgi:hypothetical protein